MYKAHKPIATFDENGLVTDFVVTVPNTCENCKAYTKYQSYDSSYCDNDVMINDDDTPPNFSCSLHEAK